jgi:hypothetical protein
VDVVPSFAARGTLCTAGELQATGYAVIRPSAASSRSRAPETHAARVVIVDPRWTETRAEPMVRSQPRNPDQKIWPPPAPGIELPDRRPLTKAQRIWIDPDLLAQWNQEAEDAERSRRSQ